jgi:hypothetical protein
MCGPKFCSMRFTQDIRDAMAEKAEEFAQHGNRSTDPSQHRRSLMRARRLTTLIGGAAIAAAIAWAPLAAAEPDQPQESCETAATSSTVCQTPRNVEINDTPSTGGFLSIRRRGRADLSRKVDNHANNTQAHRTPIPNRGRDCHSDRQSTSGGRRRTGFNGPAVPAHSALLTTGRRRIHM